MALYDDINQINAEHIRSGMAPLLQYGQNQVTQQALMLERRQALEDQANRNMFLQSQQERQQRALMGLQAQAAKEKATEAKTAFDRTVTDRRATSREKRLQVLHGYGVDLPDTASDFDLEDATQKASGTALGNTLAQLEPLEKFMESNSGVSPQEIQTAMGKKMAEDPTFSKMLLEDYPDLHEGLRTGTISPDLVYKKLSDKGWFDFNSQERKLAFMAASTNAKAALATEVAENPDARKRPGYLAAAARYALLQKEALKHIEVLRNPEYLKSALSFLGPQGAAGAGAGAASRFGQVGAGLGIGGPAPGMGDFRRMEEQAPQTVAPGIAPRAASTAAASMGIRLPALGIPDLPDVTAQGLFGPVVGPAVGAVGRGASALGGAVGPPIMNTLQRMAAPMVGVNPIRPDPMLTKRMRTQPEILAEISTENDPVKLKALIDEYQTAPFEGASREELYQELADPNTLDIKRTRALLEELQR